jgi:dienelactone hydrolase
MKKYVLLLISATFVLTSCKKNKDEIEEIPLENGNGGNGTAQCDESALPIVMVHGFLASGDTYASQAMRFSSNGYCSNRTYVFDWNTLAQGEDNASLLDAFIDQVISKTESEKVNLVGHSAGGGLSYDYLSSPERAAKVAHYVHVGSGSQSGPAGPNQEVPTLNIWSPDDLIVTGGDIPGATNLSLPGKDHYEVATCAEAFEGMYKFFNDNEAPQTTMILPQTNIELCGKVVTLGENEAREGAEVNIYEVNPETGFRISDSPNFTVTANATGDWGPIQVTKGANYEFEINTKVSGDRVIYYYREGFERSNPYVYLRTLPPPGSFVSFIFNDIPSSENQSALTVFTANQGITAGRDDLYINGIELSTPAFCDADNNTIALFMYDGNNNQQTDLTSQGLFGQFPFLSSADVYFPTSPEETITCEFNGKYLMVPNRKSSDGIIIAVFD